jgi:hypothetical protein
MHLRQLGRLLLCPIPLPSTETPAPNAAIPVIRSPTVQTFVLVLNGSSQTPWNAMTAKVRGISESMADGRPTSSKASGTREYEIDDSLYIMHDITTSSRNR